jgi:hypothetical protein
LVTGGIEGMHNGIVVGIDIGTVVGVFGEMFLG